MVLDASYRPSLLSLNSLHRSIVVAPPLTDFHTVTFAASSMPAAGPSKDASLSDGLDGFGRRRFSLRRHSSLSATTSSSFNSRFRGGQESESESEDDDDTSVESFATADDEDAAPKVLDSPTLGRDFPSLDAAQTVKSPSSSSLDPLSPERPPVSKDLQRVRLSSSSIARRTSLAADSSMSIYLPTSDADESLESIPSSTSAGSSSSARTPAAKTNSATPSPRMRRLEPARPRRSSSLRPCDRAAALSGSIVPSPPSMSIASPQPTRSATQPHERMRKFSEGAAASSSNAGAAAASPTLSPAILPRSSATVPSLAAREDTAKLSPTFASKMPLSSKSSPVAISISGPSDADQQQRPQSGLWGSGWNEYPHSSRALKASCELSREAPLGRHSVALDHCMRPESPFGELSCAGGTLPTSSTQVQVDGAENQVNRPAPSRGLRQVRSALSLAKRAEDASSSSALGLDEETRGGDKQTPAGKKLSVAARANRTLLKLLRTPRKQKARTAAKNKSGEDEAEQALPEPLHEPSQPAASSTLPRAASLDPGTRRGSVPSSSHSNPARLNDSHAARSASPLPTPMDTLSPPPCRSVSCDVPSGRRSSLSLLDISPTLGGSGGSGIAAGRRSSSSMRKLDPGLLLAPELYPPPASPSRRSSTSASIHTASPRLMSSPPSAGASAGSGPPSPILGIPIPPFLRMDPKFILEQGPQRTHGFWDREDLAQVSPRAQGDDAAEGEERAAKRESTLAGLPGSRSSVSVGLGGVGLGISRAVKHAIRRAQSKPDLSFKAEAFEFDGGAGEGLRVPAVPGPGPAPGRLSTSWTSLRSHGEELEWVGEAGEDDEEPQTRTFSAMRRATLPALAPFTRPPATVGPTAVATRCA